jgi:hypothetical protein
MREEMQGPYMLKWTIRVHADCFVQTKNSVGIMHLFNSHIVCVGEGLEGRFFCMIEILWIIH